MLTLILTAVMSILFAIFATQNTGLVDLNFGNYFVTTIPIYIAILIPILLSLVISFTLQLINNFANILTIRNQKKTIKNLKRELAEVTKELHKSELENVKFKAELGEPKDANSI